MPIFIEEKQQLPVERVPTYEDAHDPGFWRQLNPQLTITAGGSTNALFPFPASIDEEKLYWLKQDGYLQFDDMLDGVQIAYMRQAVENLYQAGINPCFTFVYDEFWAISRRLNRILSPILSERYFQLPDFWTWYLNPRHQDAGWRPHRDRGSAQTLMEDGLPKSVTVWLALTDASPLNGCIYLLPAALDEAYHDFESNSTDVNAHGIRALPVNAGSLLLWNQRVVHWGGTSSQRAREPRISLAVEFHRADVPPFNSPLIKSPSDLMPFDLRMLLIAKQIVQYRHMYHVSDELGALADRILE